MITPKKISLSGLKKTQNSISLQTKNNYEWIIIDGNSTDATKDYVLNSLKNHKYISENDAGIYDAMNKGIRISSGGYVVFLNAGDTFLHAHVLDSVEKIIQKSEHCDMFFCGANLKFGSKFHYRPVRKIEKYIWHGLPANHQATFFKLSSIANNLYSNKYKLSGDYYIVAKIYMAKSLSAYYDEPVVNFSMGGFFLSEPCSSIKRSLFNTKTHTKSIFISSFIECVKKNFDLYSYKIFLYMSV